jgi:starch-binding outer membrane protein SusE/F
MKKAIKNIFLLSLLVAAFASCKKEENRVTYDGGSDPVLTSSKSTTIPLAFLTKDEEAVKFSWTNPDYQFSTGLNSQNVSYTLQIDLANANFASASLKSLVIANDLSKTFSQSEFNSILLNDLGFAPDVERIIDVRVKSTLTNNSAPLYSPKMSFKVTPYSIPPTVAPPASGHLYFVGNASPGGWNNPVPVPTQEFTQLTPTVYELTLPLIGGNSYLFLPVNGDWGTKYGGIGANNTNNVSGDDFRVGGGDLKAPAGSGTYKVVVDFQRGKFTVTLQ